MNSHDQNELSEVKKRILARQKVQEEMDELRAKIKELRKKPSQGTSVDRDIEAYLDYLKVLKKEKDSIREGNHTTFLDAKKLISPKLNYGSRKDEVLAEIKELSKEIRATEKALGGGGYDDVQRAELDAKLIMVKEKHQEAMMELKSIEQFNHTRFLEHKELGKINNPQEEQLPSTGRQSENSTDPLKPKPLVKKPHPDLNDFNPPPMI